MKAKLKLLYAETWPCAEDWNWISVRLAKITTRRIDGLDFRGMYVLYVCVLVDGEEVVNRREVLGDCHADAQAIRVAVQRFDEALREHPARWPAVVEEGA